jgi:hypothetical protein
MVLIGNLYLRRQHARSTISKWHGSDIRTWCGSTGLSEIRHSNYVSYYVSTICNRVISR